MKTFVIGDIHGGYRSLLQVFERSKFHYDEDKLIVLGDVVDGWPQTREVVDELLKVKNLVLILGNHDEWFMEWAEHGCQMSWAAEAWVTQGGLATLTSYNYGPVPEDHLKFFRAAKLYYKDEQERVFVHGGFDLSYEHLSSNEILNKQDKDTCLWDRYMLREAWLRHGKNPHGKLSEFAEIYVGHTPTSIYNTDKPMHVCEVWAMDTGGGWEGKLSMMNVETKEVFQSDDVYTLYPDTVHARNRSRLFK